MDLYANLNLGNDYKELNQSNDAENAHKQLASAALYVLCSIQIDRFISLLQLSEKCRKSGQKLLQMPENFLLRLLMR